MNVTKPCAIVTAAFLLWSNGLTQPVFGGAEPIPATTQAANIPSGAGPATKPSEKTDDLATTVRDLRRDIDALHKKSEKEEKPWYLDVSTLIAVLSFIFAFGTTWVSNRKAKAQEMESDRNELRGLLQRMSALPRENLEAQQKFGGNPGALATVSSYINQENTVLIGQAVQIAQRLPKGKVSAVEYYAIALGLGNAYQIENQKKFLAQAIETATDFNTEIAAHRTTAVVLFQTGTPDSGRIEYQKALAIFERYPGYDEFTRNGTHIRTELAWAYSEFQVKPGVPRSAEHLDRANELVKTLVPSPGRSQFEADIAQARQQLTLPVFP